ncbi:MAG: YgiQ family radical SAM protein, partial [Lachnospiraceae bacterium]|nr:YgiQ family radical SAM protein [Lachnospiraceae bacterium]
PIIIGGIEASLRRLAHFDYWEKSFKRSVLLDSQADILLYGMAEKAVVSVADALNSGINVKDITFVKGTVYKTKDAASLKNNNEVIKLPDYTAMKTQPRKYAESFQVQIKNTDAITAKILYEAYPNDINIVVNPPSEPLTTLEMDDIYALPYMRTYHPDYEKDGGIPAIREVKFSLTSSRGCFGGCSFCALHFHQGRSIQSRSHESLIKEAEILINDKDFKGYIHDVGGPTANFRRPSCEKQLTKGVCADRQCLYPKPCPNLSVSHNDYLQLLRKLRKLPGVKKVFIRSGLRFDYLMADRDTGFFSELVEHHISGQLKVAPEHIADAVLCLMGKPSNRIYEIFAAKFKDLNDQKDKKQFLVPYLMSSHPGSNLKEAIALAEYLHNHGIHPEQVQDFYPTPGALSTVMYYTGLDPRDLKSVYVCRNPHEKAMQRALIQYRNPKNYDLVREALTSAGREDLIGFEKKCLIRPRLVKKKAEKEVKKKSKIKKTIRNVHKKKTIR